MRPVHFYCFGFSEDTWDGVEYDCDSPAWNNNADFGGCERCTACLLKRMQDYSELPFEQLLKMAGDYAYYDSETGKRVGKRRLIKALRGFFL